MISHTTPLLVAFTCLSLTSSAIQAADHPDILNRSGISGGGEMTVFDWEAIEGPSDQFLGRVEISATLCFRKFSNNPSFSFLQLGRGARPVLAIGNGWGPTVWTVFDGQKNQDISMPGDIPVVVDEPRRFLIAIDYHTDQPDVATITMTGAAESMVLRGDFSFTSVVIRNGNTPDDTTVDFTDLSITGLRTAHQSKEPLDTEPMVLSYDNLKTYVDRFNAEDEELFANIPNSEAYDFLKQNIPLFECPDEDMQRTYYFRWWTYRKHVKDTPDGYVITEFLPKVGWAGKHNTISCPAAHHFYEGRWLHDPQYMDDYAIFWLRKGGSPRSYSFWIADAYYQRDLVTPDPELLIDLLPDLVGNYQAWEKGWSWRGRNDIGQRESGLFYTIDDRDGGEASIGKHGFRPTLNSFMYGDARAIAAIADMAGDSELAATYNDKAATLKKLIQEKLWDPEAEFFKILPAPDLKSQPAKPDEPLKDVRELYGYTPWYFNLPDPGYEAGWNQLMDPEGFYAPYGPTFAEQRHPAFRLSYEGHECQWNGPSWPLATCSVLTALANLLNNYEQDVIDRDAYYQTLQCYTRSHQLTREDGTVVPWIDENIHPHTGDWIARTRLHDWAETDPELEKRKGGKHRGKDYNHSTYNDLIITGLVGLRPQAGDQVVVNPLLPTDTWDYFCLDDVHYHGRQLTIVWDRTGERYGRGAGLTLYCDGDRIAHSPTLSRITGQL